MSVLAVALGVGGSLLFGTASSGASPLSSVSASLHRLVTMPEGPPGAVAIVDRGTGSQVVVVGKGDVTTGRRPTPGDLVRLASVSKAYNGAVALALVHRGSLSLDDTIGQLLPQLPAAWSAITLRQLLQHTSGLPDYIKNPKFVQVLQADPHASMSPLQLLGFVFNTPLNFAAGTRYEYSDSDNIAVGLMVEAVTRSSYEQALARYVTRPLHLARTALPTSVAMASPYLHGYARAPGQPPEDVTDALNPALAWASGGMVATPSELDRFMRAYVGGRLFGAKEQKAQRRFVPGDSGPPGPGVNSSGLALYRYRTRCGTVYGHTGNYPGYTVFAAATANAKRSVVVVANEQVNQQVHVPVYKRLVRAEFLAVCAATK